MTTGPMERIPTGERQYAPDDIYQRILQPLHLYHIPLGLVPSTRYQQSGTCSMKSQLSYLQASLGERFRTVKEGLQKAAVNLVVSSLLAASNVDQPHMWLYILRVIAQNMARRHLKHLDPAGGLLFDDDRFKRAFDKVHLMVDFTPMNFAIHATTVAIPGDRQLKASPLLDVSGVNRIMRLLPFPSARLNIRHISFSSPEDTSHAMLRLSAMAKSAYGSAEKNALIAAILNIPGHVLRAEHYSTMKWDNAIWMEDGIITISGKIQDMSASELNFDRALALNKLLVMMWRVVCRQDTYVTGRESVPLLSSLRMSNHNLCLLRQSKFVLSYDRSLNDKLDDLFNALGFSPDSCTAEQDQVINDPYESLMTDPKAFRQWMMLVAKQITTKDQLRRHSEKAVGVHDQDITCVTYLLIATNRLRGQLADPSTLDSSKLSSLAASSFVELVQMWAQVESQLTLVDPNDLGDLTRHAKVERFCKDRQCPFRVIIANPDRSTEIDRTPDMMPHCSVQDFLDALYSGPAYESLTEHGAANRFLRPRTLMPHITETGVPVKWPVIHNAISLGQSPDKFEENDFLVDRRVAGHRLTLTTMFRDQTRIPSMLFAWQSGRLDLTDYTHQDLIDFALFQGPINTNGGLQALCQRGSPLVDAVLDAARRALLSIPPATAREQRTLLWLYALSFRVHSFRPVSGAECRTRRDLRRELENRLVLESDAISSPSVRSLAHAVAIIAISGEADCPDGRDPDWLKHLLARQARRQYEVVDDDMGSGATPAYRHIHHQADLFMAQKSVQILDYLARKGDDLWATLREIREQRRNEIGLQVSNSDFDEMLVMDVASKLRWSCAMKDNIAFTSVASDSLPSCSGLDEHQWPTCTFDVLSAGLRCKTPDGWLKGEIVSKAEDMYGHPFLLTRLSIGRDRSVVIVKTQEDLPTFRLSPSTSNSTFWTQLTVQMPNSTCRLLETDPSAVVMRSNDTQYELVESQWATVDDGAFARIVLGNADHRATRGKFAWRKIALSPDEAHVVVITDDLLQPIARCSRASPESPVLFEFADPSTSTATFRARHGRAFSLVSNETLTVPDGITFSFDVLESEPSSGRCHRVVFYEHVYLGAPVTFSTCTSAGSDHLVWEADPSFTLAPSQRLHGMDRHRFLVIRKRDADQVMAFAHVPGFTRLLDVSRRKSDRAHVKVDLIVARERFDRILLALCHFLDRRYALAMSLLQSVHLLTPWTDDEFELMRRMVVEHEDTIPEGIAVRTLVMFLDEDNRDLIVDPRKRRTVRLLNVDLLARYYRIHGNLPIRFRLLAYNDIVGDDLQGRSPASVILVRTASQELRLLQSLSPECSGFDKLQITARARWLQDDRQALKSPVVIQLWGLGKPDQVAGPSSLSGTANMTFPVIDLLNRNPLAEEPDDVADLLRQVHVPETIRARLAHWLFVASRGRRAGILQCAAGMQVERWTSTLGNMFELYGQRAFADVQVDARRPLAVPSKVHPSKHAVGQILELLEFDDALRQTMDTNLRSVTSPASCAGPTISSLQLTGVAEFERKRSEDVVEEARMGADRLRQNSARYELVAPNRQQNLLDDLDCLVQSLGDLIGGSDNAIRLLAGNHLSIVVRSGSRDDLFADGMGDGDLFEYQSLLHLLATASPTLYNARFPTLNGNYDIISMIHGALLRHVLLVVTRQHCLRIKRHVEAGDIQSAGAELAKSRLDPDTFRQIVSHPMIGVFELEADLRLRRDQFDDIVALLERRPDSVSFRSMILQRLMAAGKTFVLGTLLALAKADGYHLSVMVPPAALFEQNSADMIARSAAIFGQRARVITFSRHAQDATPTRLQALHETMVNCIRAHQYVLMAPRTLHLLQNTFIDLVSRHHFASSATDRETAAESIRWLGLILSLLKERGAATFDEVDMTFDPKLEHNLPSGNVIAADRLRVHFAARLFLHLSTSDLVDFRASHHSIDPDTYARTIRPRLIDWAADHISSSTEWAWACAPDGHPATHSPPMLDRNALLQFFSTSGAQGAIGALPDGLTTVAQDHLAYVHVQLHRKVPFALQGNVNQHYGRSSSGTDPLPRPYVAANTPSETSEIASQWELINRAAIMYLHSGLDREQAKAYIRWRQSRAYRWMDPDLSEDAIQFSNLTSGRLRLCRADPERDADLVVEALLSRRTDVQAMLMDFVVEHILTNVKVVERQITGNVQNLGSMFHSLQGYSGTLENQFIFPDRIYSDTDGIVLDRGANGQVISRILHLGQDLLHVPDGPDPLAARILRASSKSASSTTALIDIGAHFKGVRNVDVARDILHCRSRVHAVVFYDEASNQPRALVRRRNGEFEERPLPGTDAATIESVTGRSPITTKAVFTYYDHRHITGADVPQRVDSNGIATVSADTPLRDVLQGVMRLRKFLTTQTAEFVAFDGAASVVDMLRKAQVVQFEQERKQNRRSVFQKIDDVVRDAILTKMYRTAVDSDEFVALAAAIVNESDDDAVGSLFRRAQIVTFLDQIDLDDAVVEMRSLLNKHRGALLDSSHMAQMFSVAERESLRSAVDSIIARFPLLDEECPDDAPFDEGREQAQEQEQEQEEQKEEEQEIHAAVDDPAPAHTKLKMYRDDFLRQVRGDDGHVPLRRLNEVVRRAIVRQAEAGTVPVPEGTRRFIHDNIFVTDRFCQTRAGSPVGDDAVGRYQKTPFQVIVRRRTGVDPSIILASVEELNLIRELEAKSSLSTRSTLVYTTTPSNVNSVPGIVGDHVPFVQRLLADVNLYQGTLSIMNSDDWASARNEALDGTVDAFRFYLRYVLDTSSIVVASHRPEFLLNQWFPIRAPSSSGFDAQTTSPAPHA